jgi:4-alpha-glucanotransferase
LNLYPNAQIEGDVVRERDNDREMLLSALREQGLNPVHPNAPLEPYTPELGNALHLYLARSSSVLVALQIDDLLGMTDPVNVPGTDAEYPNWRRKLTASIEDIAARGDIAERLAEINRARLTGNPRTGA